MTKFIKFLFYGILIAIIASCTGYDKLLKGRDYQAKYDAGLKFYEEGKNSRVLALFSQIATIFEGSTKADTIRFYMANAHYRLGAYEESVMLFDDFRKTYGRSPFVEEAEYLYAMSYYHVSPDFELDQSPTRLAINAFAEYVSRYPNGQNIDTVGVILDELESRLTKKAFQIPETYYNIGHYNSAITSFRNTLRENPEHPEREEIMYLIVKSNYLFARGSVVEKQRERFYNTIDAGMNFEIEFPESEYIAEVKRMIENSKKLSRTREILESANKESHLSEKEILRNAKYADKLESKVIKGNLTSDEAEKLVSDRERKVEDRAKRRHERFVRDTASMNTFAAPTKDVKEQAEEIRAREEKERLKTDAEKESEAGALQTANELKNRKNNE